MSVEVTGQTSEELLEALPNLTILGVDPYLGRYNGQESRERLDGMGGEEAFRAPAEVSDFGQVHFCVKKKNTHKVYLWYMFCIVCYHWDFPYNVSSCLVVSFMY